MVALSHVAGAGPALVQLEAMATARFADFLPYQALRADLLRRTGRIEEADEAYARALDLAPKAAERRWLEAARAGLPLP